MLLGPVEGADTDEWRRMIDVNLLGLLYCTQAALPLMRERRRRPHRQPLLGRRAHRRRSGSAVYNLTKWGVDGFSEALRQEALHSNIRVTVRRAGLRRHRAPGPQRRTRWSSRRRRRCARRSASVLEAEDIADAIVYAVSQPEHVNINEILIRPTGPAALTRI